MKKEDLPQDESNLKEFSKELCYVKNSEGNYERMLSTGWEVKTEALKNAWDDINNRISNAANAVQKGESSPILFFMELNLMDIPTLSAYSGIWGFFVKRHLKAATFKKLSKGVIKKYAKAFKINPEELINFDGSDINKYIQK
jgi:hypothetical protein